MRADRRAIAEYAANGLALVGIRFGSKGPVFKAWNKAENAIFTKSDAARLTENVGLAHAYCMPTPTMALDIDDMELARAWLAARAVNLDHLLDADDAVWINSGRVGCGFRGDLARCSDLIARGIPR